MTLALDSNRYTDLQRGIEGVVERVASSARVYVPFPVLAELHYGFRNGSFREENERGLREFLALPSIEVLWADELMTQVYSDLKLYLRGKGTPIPENDVWIAAVCVRHGVPLYTRDAHFDRLPQVMRT